MNLYAALQTIGIFLLIAIVITALSCLFAPVGEDDEGDGQ